MGKLDSINSAALGKLNAASLVVVEKVIDADASSGLTAGVDFGMEIIDVIAISTATVASATVTVSDGTNDITNAIDIDTVDVKFSAASIDTTYSALSAGDSLTFTTAGASDRAKVYVIGLRK